MNCQNPSFVGKMFQTEKFMFFNRSRVSFTGIIFGKKRVWGLNRCCLKAVGFFFIKAILVFIMGLSSAPRLTIVICYCLVSFFFGILDSEVKSERGFETYPDLLI